MFITVISVVSAVVVLVCIGIILLIIGRARETGWNIFPVCGIMVMLCLIAFIVFGVCLMHDWGNPETIEQCMTWLGIVGTCIVGVMLSIVGGYFVNMRK